jgi:hypothetical protein
MTEEEAAPKVNHSVEKKFNVMRCFVRELSNFFKEDLSIKLYNHLLEKTTLANKIPVEKHLTLFANFCKENRTKIETKQTDFPLPVIQYSERVKLDFAHVFSQISKEENQEETLSVLFDHLWVISSVFDPESKTGELLKKKQTVNKPPPELENLFRKNPFLSEMMTKVEKNVKPGTTPMEAMNSMMQSGMLQELVQGMQTNINNGTLNVQELMGTVQSLTSGLPPEQLQALQPMMGMAMQNMGPAASQQEAALSETPLLQSNQAVTVCDGGPKVRGGKKKRKKKKKN